MIQTSLFGETAAPTVPYPDAPSAVIVSVSGGIDSAAVAVWARRRWPHAHLILWHAYLTMDWPETSQVIDDLAVVLGNVSRVTVQAVYRLDGSVTPGGFNGTHLDRLHDVQLHGPAVAARGEIVDLLAFARQARNGMPPTKKIRWCTDYFKARIFDRWLRANRAALGPSPVLLSGERWAESAQRSKLPAWAWRCGIKPSQDWPDGWRCLWARPLIDQPLHAVTQLVLGAGAAIHPGYFAQGETLAQLLDPGRDERGRARLSCRVCIFSQARHISAALRAAPEQMQSIVAEVQHFERDTGYSWQMHGPLAPHGGPLLRWEEALDG